MGDRAGGSSRFLVSLLFRALVPPALATLVRRPGVHSKMKLALLRNALVPSSHSTNTVPARCRR